MLFLSMIIDDSQSLIFKKKTMDVNESIFKEIGAGDMDALEHLYASTEKAIYAYLMSLTKDHELTVDLLQDTYLKIMASAHLYQPKGKPMAWMFSISKNLFLDELRKRKREVSIGEVEIFDKINIPYEIHPDEKMLLEAALNELSQEERSIIMLFAVTGLKHREIAELLEMNLSTVLSKYHRGLRKLKAFI